MLPDEEKLCPACKMMNNASATTCNYCGIPFEGGKIDTSSTTIQMLVDFSYPADETNGLLDKHVREIPENGIAIYLANFMYPFDVRLESDFVIGRKPEGAPAGFLDLTPLEGYIMGVSKQHVRIQCMGNGYQITDLGSTNGTWVNDVRLIPNQPTFLPNAAQVRIGRMELYFLYRLKNK
jgi:pSer/pThr/pTyr-binding forkhead associated (FHA) protein